MNTLARIKEVFISTQGEGPYIGHNQLFIRFCSCNLSCKFCDTDFTLDNQHSVYSVEELCKFINAEFDLNTVHSISYTGGEPLIHSNFLKEFLPRINHCHYLETNATLSDKLIEVLDLIDIISADIKLPSATGISGTFQKHEDFFRVARTNPALELFAKVVFDENITDEEILLTTSLAKKYDFQLILQPKTNLDGTLPNTAFLESIFEKFLKSYRDTRLIPQVHKFLDIR